MAERVVTSVVPRLSQAAAPLSLFALGLGGLVLRVWQPSDDLGASICLFRRCTGVSCPGCGMTRAAAALMKGRWDAAWAYHPLALAVVLQLVAGSLVWAAASAGWVRRDLTGVLQWVLVLNLVALLAVWVLRLITGTLP